MKLCKDCIHYLAYAQRCENLYIEIGTETATPLPTYRARECEYYCGTQAIYFVPKETKPDPGEGFRLLGKDEVRQPTDEYYHPGAKRWHSHCKDYPADSPETWTWRRTTRPAKCRICGFTPHTRPGWMTDTQFICACGCSGPVKPNETQAVDGWNVLHLEG